MSYSSKKSLVARLIRTSDGAPTDLAAPTGALCSDTTNGALYINAGDHDEPDWAAVTGGDGEPVTVAWGDVTGKPSTFPPSSGSSAATTTATAISPGTATDVQGILEELAARIADLEP